MLTGELQHSFLAWQVTLQDIRRVSWAVRLNSFNGVILPIRKRSINPRVMMYFFLWKHAEKVSINKRYIIKRAGMDARILKSFPDPTLI